MHIHVHYYDCAQSLSNPVYGDFKHMPTFDVPFCRRPGSLGGHKHIDGEELLCSGKGKRWSAARLGSHHRFIHVALWFHYSSRISIGSNVCQIPKESVNIGGGCCGEYFCL